MKRLRPAAPRSLKIRGRARRLAVAALIACLLAAAPALGAFPGANPDESVRLNTPNDPDFDSCEPDNEGGATCSNVFDEELERFGFAPNASQLTALYKPPFDAHVTRLQAQNTAAGRNPLGQVSGVSADRAWKRSIGRPDVEIAILDTGIRWNNRQLRKKIALNEAELPTPQTTGGAACAQDDCNNDGAFDVDDFANDPRVSVSDGHAESDSLLDASDLIAAFDGDGDNDGNGYVDDIAGWDFFDDDNDPYDASSYSSASNHGSGRAVEAGSQTNDGAGGTGVCPRCQIVPLRSWDTFVTDVNNFSQAVLYAADNNIEVVEGAVGGLFNSRFGRAAFREAYRKGVFLAIVSSDLNTADHNIPTVYDEAMQVQGSVSDVEGLGQSSAEIGAFLGDLGIPTSAPIGTWFRNSGTTQYGGHAHVVMPAVTGSQATGQAAGAAGLVASFGRQKTPGRAARAERDQAAAHAHRRGRGGAEHHRHRRGRPGAGRLGPALRLRPPRPRARARADRRGQDPAAGPHHGTRLVRAAQPRSPDLGSDQRTAVRQARGRLHVEAPVGARHRARRGGLPGREHAERLGADRRRARHDQPERRACRARRAHRRRRHHGSHRARQGPGRRGPERAGLHRARGGHRLGRATAARTARCCSPTATPPCTRAGRGTPAPAARRRSGCTT